MGIITALRNNGRVVDVGMDSVDPALLTSTQKIVWRDDFPDSALSPDEWDVTTGEGMTVSVANSVLTIAAGTTANSETIIKSKRKFTIPVLAMIIMQLSQRIVNQEIYFGLVNDSEDMIVHILHDGSQDGLCRANAYNSGSSAGAITSGGLNSSLSSRMYEIEAFADSVNFWQRQLDTSGTRVAIGTKHARVPDPSQEYYVRIRVKNLAVAPASNTNVSIDCVSVQDNTAVAVEVASGRGGSSLNDGVPVVLAPNGQVTALDYLTSYSDTSTSLGANATFTGTTRDLGASPTANKIRVLARADQAGTAYVEQSTDGTNWEGATSWSHAIAAGESCYFAVPIMMRYWRVKYVNGEQAQGSFRIASAYAKIGAE